MRELSSHIYTEQVSSGGANSFHKQVAFVQGKSVPFVLFSFLAIIYGRPSAKREKKWFYSTKSFLPFSFLLPEKEKAGGADARSTRRREKSIYRTCPICPLSDLKPRESRPCSLFIEHRSGPSLLAFSTPLYEAV